MSVINSMLRDLDRRHAPSPFKGNSAINANVPPSLAQSNRAVPRSAIALCVLIALVIFTWNQHRKIISNEIKSASVVNDQKVQAQEIKPLVQTVEVETVAAQPTAPESRRLDSSFATTRRTFSETKSISGDSEATSMPTTVAANEEVNQLTSQKVSASKNNLAEKPLAEASSAKETVAVINEAKAQAPIIKQERKTDADVNAERYQLARSALAQNQPQRAYDLLRDAPPSLANNTDYHAVLAAVEQQLGHFADASLRYQQLLTIDQNQASWWLGLALSLDNNPALEGQHRRADALAAYQHALALNSLPDAARDYAKARIAALNHSAEQ